MVGAPATLLTEARRAAKLTQADLAQRSGVPRSVISLYETGAREPGAKLFLRLLAATGATVSVRLASEEQVRRGRVLSDLLAFAEELPHRWPGDRLQFPSEVWRT